MFQYSRYLPFVNNLWQLILPCICGAQFKNRYTQALFSQLSTLHKKIIHYNFFVSYHGHSIADSHAGHMKRVLLQEFLNSQDDRKLEVENWGPHDSKTTATVIMEHVSCTFVAQLDKIERDTERIHKPNVKPLKGIKQYHCFVYDPHQPNQCKAYALTNVQEHEHTYYLSI